MAKKQGKGIFSALLDLIWFVIFAALILAFINVNEINNVGDFINSAKIKSLEVNACVNDSIDYENIQCSLRLKVGNYKGSVKKTEKKTNTTKITDLIVDPNKKSTPKLKNSSEYTKLLNNINIVKQYDKVDYNRKDWKHWSAVDKKHSCWNTREEVMYNNAVKGSLVLLDKDKKETTKKSEACSIKSGKWIDSYSGEEIDSPSKIDIDHLVPLKAVAQSGGQKWSKEEKEQYANDYRVLVVTSSQHNRSKGAKTPSEWMPPDKKFHCDYAKQYTGVVSKYNLNLTKKDKEILQKALESCK